MRFGLKREPGFLPVFSVNSPKEAVDLLTLTCPKNYNGDFFSPSLAEEQTLGRLFAFGEKLREAYAMIPKTAPVVVPKKTRKTRARKATV